MSVELDSDFGHFFFQFEAREIVSNTKLPPRHGSLANHARFVEGVVYLNPSLLLKGLADRTQTVPRSLRPPDGSTVKFTTDFGQQKKTSSKHIAPEYMVHRLSRFLLRVVLRYYEETRQTCTHNVFICIY